MAGKKKKISPLDIEFAGKSPRKTWFDKITDKAFRVFLIEARDLFRNGNLPNVSGPRDFYRFALKSRDEHWPGVDLPAEQAFGRWANA
ncbi:MAG: hypothetical protein NXI04_18875 [Planctomycetaceae bacterium]|nr:hypothetical protein [Planctomycetaceae bacterium]